jgi:mannose-6-phosphate isomerase-like protein (cupin superfamily)
VTDGQVLAPGAGQLIPAAGMTLKIGADQSARWSVFEAEVGPGFDVGAHLHGEVEELFYILEGELDLLAFEPRIRTSGDWSGWESATGATAVRGGPGACMYVPAGCPHAFANRGDSAARMLFLAAPSGHERYLAEIGELLGGRQIPDQDAIAAVRARYDIQQLTPLIPAARV